ncbi:hypothetical protein MANES_08G069560v8 [Manihot esculenta]|uniref:Uncharacterized protein n=1 Tax=Manihot esculenta TaxID=3983 RepID=A0ACB7H989_MANES|nr:hypothetical protein MANES_08G069560v8 [Manihot esculenta]
MRNEIVGFKQLKELCVDDEDFRKIWRKCFCGYPVDNFYVLDGHLMHENQLCTLRTSLREKVIHDLHGRLARHLERDKSIAVMKERSYWPQLRKDVTRFIMKCCTCQRSKG